MQLDLRSNGPPGSAATPTPHISESRSVPSQSELAARRRITAWLAANDRTDPIYLPSSAQVRRLHNDLAV